MDETHLIRFSGPKPGDEQTYIIYKVWCGKRVTIRFARYQRINVTCEECLLLHFAEETCKQSS
jgi:hypothetical protein